MSRQHNPYLYGIRVEGTFYPLSDRASEYEPYPDFGDYIDYYIHFQYIPKEYVENIHKIKQALNQRDIKIYVEGYHEILDTYFINVSGYFSGEFNYGMDNYGNIEIMFSMREYKVGSGVGNDVSGSSTRLV